MSHIEQDNEERGLISTDDTERWIVSIDEMPDCQNWLLEIDSNYLYLTLQLGDFSILGRAIDLLNSTLAEPVTGTKVSFDPNDDIVLGRFGEAMVHLLRDNEDFPRCFILVKPKSECALRISLDAGSIRAFSKALSVALADYSGLAPGGQ